MDAVPKNVSMNKDPELRELALSVIERLCEGLRASIKEARKLKEGETQDYDTSPGHIIDELQTAGRLL